MPQSPQEGRPVGRKPGPRFERCCPACRQNFVTPGDEQLFCSKACRYSPLGRSIIGAKGGATRSGRPLSVEHRAKLRASSVAAARPVEPAPSVPGAPLAVIGFAGQSANLTDATRAELDQVAKRIAELGVRRIELRGLAFGGIESRKVALARARTALRHVPIRRFGARARRVDTLKPPGAAPRPGSRPPRRR